MNFIKIYGNIMLNLEERIVNLEKIPKEDKVNKEKNELIV